MIKAILFDFVGVLLFKRDDYIPDRLLDEVDNIVGGVIDDVEFNKTARNEFGLSEKQLKEILTGMDDSYKKY